MSFIEAFIGSTQSQFAAYAIIAAVISICISIILTGTDMTIGNRFLLIFFVILAVIPSILLMLLQITCMVTGGNEDERWWCWLYSWIISIFVIIYCIFVIIISLTSLFTYNNAINKVDMSEQNNKMSPENSNNYAKMMIETNTKEAIEKFMNQNDSSNEEEEYSKLEEFKDIINSSNIPLPISTEQSQSSSLSSQIQSEKPLSSIQPTIKKDKIEHKEDKKEEKKEEKFNSKEIITEDIEPFSNYQYSYL